MTYLYTTWTLDWRGVAGGGVVSGDMSVHYMDLCWGGGVVSGDISVHYTDLGLEGGGGGGG